MKSQGFGVLWLLGSVAAGWGQVQTVPVATGCQSVVVRRWDAVLGRSWKFVTDCQHPERPARLLAEVLAEGPGSVTGKPANVEAAAMPVTPLLVRAGDTVRLWQRETNVRIEIAGVAEQGARIGGRIVVRVTRQTEDSGLTVERIAGTVRGIGDVEMER